MKRLHLCISALICVAVGFGNAQAQTATDAANVNSTTTLKARQQAAAAATPVTGSGATGQLTKWLGTDGVSFTLGSSVITENKFGLIGIGTTAPTSKLTVQGMIEATLGGFKFPDGTIQTTSGLTSIFHDATLMGNGSNASPLRVALPLSLSGSSNPFIITAKNTFEGGGAISARGGDNFGLYPFFGGDGIVAQGGYSEILLGGAGVNATGGIGRFVRGGDGVKGVGGVGHHLADGGTGVNGVGGNSALINGGIGVIAQGGDGNQDFQLNPTARGGDGLFARAGLGVQPGRAAQFVGDVMVTGTLSKSAGSFKIDHPLDPENKYLYHSFVESPEMMNIYNGNVMTDENGDAVITLPDWFESLNRDFRYQLTVIGTFAQAIVASEMKDNHFAIKTNAPNVKVSWQVTGVRQDAFAKAHRISVEEDKPEKERGHYLHPELFNQPEEKSIEWVRHPELMKEMKEKREQMKAEQKRTLPNQ